MKKRKSWKLPIDPCPASRPRVGRWGAYYSGKYKDFMDQSELVVGALLENHAPFEVPLEVWVTFHIPRPKSNTDLYPINQRTGDIDNHIKSVLDAFNPDTGAKAKRKAGRGQILSPGLWSDDSLIQTIHATKVWAAPDRVGWIEIAVKEKV